MLQIFPKTLRVIGIVSLLAACTATPSANFYLLKAQSSPTAVIPEGVKKHIIGLGPLSMPALLERKQIVTRSDLNSVQIAEFHQWAAPLRDNVAQVLAQNLASLQTHSFIRAYPWSAYGPVNYRVIIDINRFDTQPGQSVNLEANWAIMEEKTHLIITNKLTKIEHPLPDRSYPATVKALNEALYEFSRELSLAIDQL